MLDIYLELLWRQEVIKKRIASKELFGDEFL